MKLTGRDKPIGKSQSGRTQVVFKWVVLEGEERGQNYTSFHGLETEDNMMWFMNDLSKMGLDPLPQNPQELEEALDALVEAGVVMKIRLLTKVSPKDGNEYQNPRIQKRMETYEQEAPAEPAPAGNNEGEPAEESAATEEVVEETVQEETVEEEVVEEPVEEEGVELQVGHLVDFAYKGKTQRGKVIGIPDETKVKLQIVGTNTAVTLPMDTIQAIVEEEAPPAPSTTKVSRSK
jgi:hypothetical protein